MVKEKYDKHDPLIKKEQLYKKSLKIKPLQKEDGKNSVKNPQPKNRTNKRINKKPSEFKFLDNDKKTRKKETLEFNQFIINKKKHSYQKGGAEDEEEAKQRMLKGLNYITDTGFGPLGIRKLFRDLRAELKGVSLLKFKPAIFTEHFEDVWEEIDSMGILDKNRQRFVKFLQIMEIGIFYLNYVFVIQSKLRSLLSKMEIRLEQRVVTIFNCKITHDDLLEGKKGFFSRLFSSEEKAAVDKTTTQPANIENIDQEVEESQAGGSRNTNISNKVGVAAALTLTSSENNEDNNEDNNENNNENIDSQIGGGSLAEQVFLYGKSFGIVGPNNFGKTENIGIFKRLMSYIFDRERRSYTRELSTSSPGQGKFLRSYINYLHGKIKKYQSKFKEGIKPLIKSQTKLRRQYKFASDVISFLSPKQENTMTAEQKARLETLNSTTKKKLETSPELDSIKKGLRTFFDNFEKDYLEIINRYDKDLTGFWVQDKYGRVIHNLYKVEGESTRELEFLMKNIDITGYDSQVAQNVFSNVYKKVAAKDLKFEKKQPKQTYFEVRKIALEVLCYSRCLVQAQIWDDFSLMQGFNIDVKKMETPNGIKEQCITFPNINSNSLESEDGNGLLHKMIICDENMTLFNGKTPEKESYVYAGWSTKNQNQEAGLNGFLSYGAILGYYDDNLDNLGIPKHPYLDYLSEKKRLAIINSTKKGMKEMMTRQESQVTKIQKGGDMSVIVSELAATNLELQKLEKMTPAERTADPDSQNKYIELGIKRNSLVAQINVFDEKSKKDNLAAVEKEIAGITSEQRGSNKLIQDKYENLISQKTILTNQLAIIDANKKLQIGAITNYTKQTEKHELIFKRRFLDVNTSKEQRSWFDVWRLHMYENFYVFSSLLDTYMNHDVPQPNQPPSLFEVTPDFFYRFYQTAIHERFIAAYTTIGLYDLLYRSFMSHMQQKIKLTSPKELAKFKFQNKLPYIGIVAQQLYAYPLLVNQANNVRLFDNAFHERLKVVSRFAKDFMLDYYNSTVFVKPMTTTPGSGDIISPTEDLHSFGLITKWLEHYFNEVPGAFIYQTKYKAIFTKSTEIINKLNDDDLPPPDSTFFSSNLEDLVVGKSYTLNDKGAITEYDPSLETDNLPTSLTIPSTPPTKKPTLDIKKTKWGHHLFTGFFEPTEEFKKPEEVSDEDYKFMLMARNPIIRTNKYYPLKALTDSNQRGKISSFFKGSKMAELISILPLDDFEKVQEAWEKDIETYKSIRGVTYKMTLQDFHYYLGNNLNEDWVEAQSRLLVHYLYACQTDSYIKEILDSLENPRIEKELLLKLMADDTETRKHSDYYKHGYLYFIDCIIKYLTDLKNIDDSRLESYFNVNLTKEPTREFDLLDFLNMLMLTIYIPIIPSTSSGKFQTDGKMFEIDSLDESVDDMLPIKISGLGDLKIKIPQQISYFGKGGSIIPVKKTLRRPIKQKEYITEQNTNKNTNNKNNRRIRSKKLLRKTHGGAIILYNSDEYVSIKAGKEQKSEEITAFLPFMKYYFGKRLKTKYGQVLSFLNLKLNSQADKATFKDRYVIYRVFDVEYTPELNKSESIQRKTQEELETFETKVIDSLSKKMDESYRTFVSQRGRISKFLRSDERIQRSIADYRRQIEKKNIYKGELQDKYQKFQSVNNLFQKICAFLLFPGRNRIDMKITSSNIFTPPNRSISSRSHNNYKFYTESPSYKTAIKEIVQGIQTAIRSGTLTAASIKTQIEALITKLKAKIPAPSTNTNILTNIFLQAKEVLGFENQEDLGADLEKSDQYKQPFEEESTAQQPIIISKMIMELDEIPYNAENKDEIFKRIYKILPKADSVVDLLAKLGAKITDITGKIGIVVSEIDTKLNEIDDAYDNATHIVEVNDYILNSFNNARALTNVKQYPLLQLQKLHDKLKNIQIMSSKEKKYPFGYSPVKTDPPKGFYKVDGKSDQIKVDFLKNLADDIEYLEKLIDEKKKVIADLLKSYTELNESLAALNIKEDNLLKLKAIYTEIKTDEVKVYLRNNSEIIDSSDDSLSKLAFVKSYLETLRKQLLLIKFDFLSYNQAINLQLFSGDKGKENTTIELKSTKDSLVNQVYETLSSTIVSPDSDDQKSWNFNDDNMRVYNHILREWSIASYDSDPDKMFKKTVKVNGKTYVELMEKINESMLQVVSKSNDLFKLVRDGVLLSLFNGNDGIVSDDSTKLLFLRNFAKKLFQYGDDSQTLHNIISTPYSSQADKPYHDKTKLQILTESINGVNGVNNPQLPGNPIPENPDTQFKGTQLNWLGEFNYPDFVYNINLNNLKSIAGDLKQILAKNDLAKTKPGLLLLTEQIRQITNPVDKEKAYQDGLTYKLTQDQIKHIIDGRANRTDYDNGILIQNERYAIEAGVEATAEILKHELPLSEVNPIENRLDAIENRVDAIDGMVKKNGDIQNVIIFSLLDAGAAFQRIINAKIPKDGGDIDDKDIETLINELQECQLSDPSKKIIGILQGSSGKTQYGGAKNLTARAAKLFRNAHRMIRNVGQPRLLTGPAAAAALTPAPPAAAAVALAGAPVVPPVVPPAPPAAAPAPPAPPTALPPAPPAAAAPAQQPAPQQQQPAAAPAPPAAAAAALAGAAPLVAGAPPHPTNAVLTNMFTAILNLSANPENQQFKRVTLQLITKRTIPYIINEYIPLLTTYVLINLPPDLIAALTSPQIQALTTAQIQALTTAQIQALMVSDLIPGKIKDLTRLQIQDLTTGQITSLKKNQTAALTTAQIQALTTPQIQALNVADLIPRKIVNLIPTQIADLTPPQIKALTTDQITALTPAQIVHLIPAQIAALTNAQIPALTTDQIAALTNAQIQALTDNQIVHLKNAQIIALTNTQIAVLIPQQIKALGEAQIQVLKPNQIQALITNQIQAFENDQIAALTTDQIKALTDNQIQALTPVQIAALTTDQIKVFSLSQIQALTPVQIAALTADQIKVFSLSQIQALTPAQIPNLINIQLSALTPLQILYFSHAQANLITDGNIEKDTPAFHAKKITEFLEKMNNPQIFKVIPGIGKQIESMSKFTELLSEQLGQINNATLETELRSLTPDKRLWLILLTAFLMLHYKKGFFSSISKTPLHLGKLIKTLTDNDVEALQPEHIDVLMQQQITEFELSQVLKLQQPAAKKLSEKIKTGNIKLDKMIQIVINIRALLPEEIQSLSEAEFKVLIEGLEHFSEDQIGKLTTAKINQLEKSDIEKLSIQQLTKLALFKETKHSLFITQQIENLNKAAVAAAAAAVTAAAAAGPAVAVNPLQPFDRLAQSRSELDGTELNAIMGYVAILALFSDPTAAAAATACKSVFDNGKNIQQIVSSRISITIAPGNDKIITKDDLYQMLEVLFTSPTNPPTYPNPIKQEHQFILDAISNKNVDLIFTQTVKDALSEPTPGNVIADGNIGLPIITAIIALMALMSPAPAENISNKLCNYLIKSGQAQELLSSSAKKPSTSVSTKFDSSLNIVPKDTNSDNIRRKKAAARTDAVAALSDKSIIDGLISNGVYDPLFIDYLDKLKPDATANPAKVVDNILPIIAQSSLRKILFKVFHPMKISDRTKDEVRSAIEARKQNTSVPVKIPEGNTIIDTLIASGMAERQILNNTKIAILQQQIYSLVESRKQIKKLVEADPSNKKKIDYVKALKAAQLLGVPPDVINEIEKLNDAINTDPYKSHIELKSKFLNECLVFYLNNKGLMLANILGIKIEDYELFYKLFIDNLGKTQDNKTISAFLQAIFKEFSYLRLIDIYQLWKELYDIPLDTKSLRKNSTVDDMIIIKNHLFKLFQYLTHDFAAIEEIKLSCESLFVETKLDLSLKDKSVPYQGIVKQYLDFMKKKYPEIEKLDDKTSVSTIKDFDSSAIDWGTLINDTPSLDVLTVTEPSIEGHNPSSKVTYFQQIDSIKIIEIITNAKLLFQNITNLETQLKHNELTILDVDSNLLLNKKILFYLLKLLALLQNNSTSPSVSITGNLIDSANQTNAERFDVCYTYLLIMNILSNLAKIDGVDDSSKNKQMSIGKLLEDYTIAIPERVINAVMTLSDLRQFDNTRLNREMLSGDKYPVSKLFLKAELSNITQGYPYYFQIADKISTFAERMKAATEYFNPANPDGHGRLKKIGFRLEDFKSSGSS